MREILGLAWKRFNIIVGVIADVQGRVIAVLFYWTIFVPFGLGSRLFSDPLRQREFHQSPSWPDRPPVPTDLDSAKRQG